ncbi:hypothetical protein SLS62_003483 [Diatrype stigma]|uniref:E3 ubiquitin ligase complex SCF subunit n=1 Tax=Diatrype stigma TaxID=117547 RepID=A0AAN9V6K6_9PEZI
MSITTSTKVTLQSDDSEQFTVDRKVVLPSGLIRELLEDLPELEATMVIPIPGCSGAVLEKVLEWCERYCDGAEIVDFYTADEKEFTSWWVEHPARKQETRPYQTTHRGQESVANLDVPIWDSIFLDVGMDDLIDLINAANYLEIEVLFERCCKTMAVKLTGKTTEEMRKILGVVSDLAPEEEKRIREDNEWAYSS